MMQYFHVIAGVPAYSIPTVTQGQVRSQQEQRDRVRLQVAMHHAATHDTPSVQAQTTVPVHAPLPHAVLNAGPAPDTLAPSLPPTVATAPTQHPLPSASDHTATASTAVYGLGYPVSATPPPVHADTHAGDTVVHTTSDSGREAGDEETMYIPMTASRAAPLPQTSSAPTSVTTHSVQSAVTEPVDPAPAPLATDETVDNILTCPICFEHYCSSEGGAPHSSDPVTLMPCGHTLCKGCLDAWARQGRRDLLCPLCKAEVLMRAPAVSVKQLASHILTEGGEGIGRGTGE
ncbi:hypothetical protein KIPB_002992 [Kipferlia bialata]|uniref:RING-type domain-containing protein n=1 Tax=Kipferlia bialata TaxID=797122 RepID=A0A9K3GFH0_9EUKA|nr:hypothetical protein KIPB_002992 [Kipferlia bialata]|eukprot:g2992.t1